MINLIPRYIGLFLFLLLVQVLVLNNIQLSGYLNPYIYILFILVLPFETPAWLILILGFMLGVSVDAFTHTPGMHASATTLMAFIRPGLLKVMAPRDGYENETTPSITHYGFAWFAKYVAILIVVHHIALFMVEAGRIEGIGQTLLKALTSSLFTWVLLVMTHYFFRRRNR
ncbi:MAG: rod shape-determining protein MreD [Bacteroidales bacterium]